MNATPAQQQVDKFNEDNAIGTPVSYWPGLREGTGRDSFTTTPAWVMGGHSAMVTVDGYSGGIALSHVKAIW